MAKTRHEVKVKQSTAEAAPAEATTRAPFWPLREEINRLFDEFDPARWSWPLSRRSLAPEPMWPWAREGGGRAPTMDLVEHDDAYEISAELPGLGPDDIEVTMTDRTLAIEGEKREEHERKEADFHLSERRYGAFRRTVHLPEGIDADRVEAKVADGVLTVRLPKTPRAKAARRKVEVNAA